MRVRLNELCFSVILPLVLAISPAFGRGAADTAEHRVRKLMEATSVPGMSVTVMKNGRILWSRGFGKADLEDEVSVTSKTRFRLASVSKVVTAAAVARLADAGKLDLDTPISRYVAGLPPRLGAVTSRQLSGHLAGVRHYQGKDFFPSPIDHRNFESVASSLEIFKNDALLSEPGEKYSYTTFGFTLLAAVVESASGEPFLQILKKEVFRPLSIESGGPDSRSLIIPKRTSFYERAKDGTIVNAPYVNPSYKWAGGGLLMNAEDLARFGNGHLNPGFISKNMLDAMFSSQKTSDGSETGVGIAWRITEGYFGNRIYHHEGSMHGTRSALLLYPEQQLVVAFLSNLSGTPAFGFETAQLIAEPYIGETEKQIVDPTGRFEVTGKALGKDVEGILEVRKTDDGYSGSLDFGETRVEVIGVIPSRKGNFLVVTHPRGGLDAIPVFGKSGTGSRYELNFKRLKRS